MPERETFLKYLREIQVKFSRLYTSILTKADLTLPQYALLSHLSQAGQVPMTQLSERLHISKPAVTNLVDRLEKKRCLKRLPHAKDRRIHLIKLESKGERIVKKTQGYVSSFLLKTFEPFNTKEKETIQHFYSLLSKTMDEVLLSRGDDQI